MTWRNISMAKEDESARISWHTESRRIDDLIPYEENPRQITKKQIKDLKESLELFNLAEIPTVNIDNTVIAGHQQLKTLQILGRGKDRISVRVPNRKLTRKEVEEYNRNGNFIKKLWETCWLNTPQSIREYT